MSPKRSGLPRTGRLAFLLSLAVHGGLALLIVAWPGRSGPKPPHSSPLVDAVAVAPEEVMPLSIVQEQALPSALPAETPLVRVPAKAPGVSHPTPRAETSSNSSSLPPNPVENMVHSQEPGPAPSKLVGSSPDPGPGGHGIPGGTTAFFNVATDGQSIVYVIDRSASMGPVRGGQSGLDTARRELLASLELLPATARFQIVLYNLSAQVLAIDGTTGLVLATREHKREAARLLDSQTAEGRTDHGPALARALCFRPDVIFFLTDADDLTPEQVSRVSRINAEQNGGRTVIHTIELNTTHRDRLDMPLQVLARSNRGTYRAVSLEGERGAE